MNLKPNSHRFNLVIEMLFFSSANTGLAVISYDSFKLFQSRNRDAFLFKWRCVDAQDTRIVSFNLVIEMLFFSSRYNNREAYLQL